LASKSTKSSSTSFWSIANVLHAAYIMRANLGCYGCIWDKVRRCVTDPQRLHGPCPPPAPTHAGFFSQPTNRPVLSLVLKGDVGRLSRQCREESMRAREATQPEPATDVRFAHTLRIYTTMLLKCAGSEAQTYAHLQKRGPGKFGLMGLSRIFSRGRHPRSIRSDISREVQIHAPNYIRTI
jgi:hypothetical protein